MGSLTFSVVTGLFICMITVVNSFLCRNFKFFGRAECVKVSRSMDDSYTTAFNQGQYQETVLYADDDIIVVNKPPDLQTAPGVINKQSLAGRIATMYNLPRVDKIIAHRLDYATSGIVVFARNELALVDLNRQFRDSCVHKVYTAIVLGKLKDDRGKIDLPIARDQIRGAPFFAVNSSSTTAKKCVTLYEVIERRETCTAVKLYPQTGR